MTNDVYLTDLLTKVGLLLGEASPSFLPYYVTASEPRLDSGRSNDHEAHLSQQLQLLVAPPW